MTQDRHDERLELLGAMRCNLDTIAAELAEIRALLETLAAGDEPPQEARHS